MKFHGGEYVIRKIFDTCLLGDTKGDRKTRRKKDEFCFPSRSQTIAGEVTGVVPSKHLTSLLTFIKGY